VPGSQNVDGPIRYSTILRTTPQQRWVAISFTAVGGLLGLVMLLGAVTPNSGEGVGVPIVMTIFFFAFAAVGINGATSEVRCNSQQISVRRWFRTKIIARSSIESISGGPVRTNAIAMKAGQQIGIRIKMHGRQRPCVPGCLRTYDSKRNRLLLAERLAALAPEPEYNVTAD
jgi:hypothetical protein